MNLARVWLLSSSLAVVASVSACATGGGPPRPQPFPGSRPAPSTPGGAGGSTPAPGSPLTPETPPTRSALVATALSLRGVPYANGGSEPSRGFDCSGFVQWVFARYGTSLPREVREQYDAGQTIDKDDVEPGDLVFFETVSRGPSHVGIALGAGGFVHAPGSRGVVRVERYTSGYWAARWVGARRVGVLETSESRAAIRRRAELEDGAHRSRR